MHDPKEATLVIEQGATLKQWFRIRLKQTGEVADLPALGYNEAHLHIRDKHASDGGELLLDLNTGNGGITLGLIDDGTGTSWSGYLYAVPSATAVLEPWGEGVYDLMAVHDDTNVEIVRRGAAVLVKRATVL